MKRDTEPDRNVLGCALMDGMDGKRRTIVLAAAAVVALVVVLMLARRDERATHDPGAQGTTASNAATPPKISTSVLAPMLAIPVGTVTAAPSAVGAPQPTITAEWGSALGMLGRARPEEANPEAPMSLAVGPDGTTWVLDQVNGRLVRYGKDGKPIDSVPLPVDGAQDVTVAKDGSVLVLDRLVDKRVAVLGPDGKVKGHLSLEGKGLSDTGGATGVFTDGKDVYVEREHEQAVKVGDTDGKSSSDDKEIPGRPTRDGKGYVRAWLGEIPGSRLFVTGYDKGAEPSHRFTRQITTPMAMTGIVALDSDAMGIIYVAVIGGAIDASGEPVGDPIVSLYCLEPAHGVPIGQATLPANTSPEETFRELAILPEGGAIYMTRTESGVSITPVDCRPQG